MADAGSATARYAFMASLATGSEIPSANSDSVTPGETRVTRTEPSDSWRSPSVIARTAYLVAQ